jgi:hypothetical protein
MLSYRNSTVFLSGATVTYKSAIQTIEQATGEQLLGRAIIV